MNSSNFSPTNSAPGSPAIKPSEIEIHPHETEADFWGDDQCATLANHVGVAAAEVLSTGPSAVRSGVVKPQGKITPSSGNSLQHLPKWVQSIVSWFQKQHVNRHPSLQNTPKTHVFSEHITNLDRLSPSFKQAINEGAPVVSQEPKAQLPETPSVERIRTPENESFIPEMPDQDRLEYLDMDSLSREDAQTAHAYYKSCFINAVGELEKMKNPKGAPPTHPMSRPQIESLMVDCLKKMNQLDKVIAARIKAEIKASPKATQERFARIQNFWGAGYAIPSKGMQQTLNFLKVLERYPAAAKNFDAWLTSCERVARSGETDTNLQLQLLHTMGTGIFSQDVLREITQGEANGTEPQGTFNHINEFQELATGMLQFSAAGNTQFIVDQHKSGTTGRFKMNVAAAPFYRELVPPDQRDAVEGHVYSSVSGVWTQASFEEGRPTTLTLSCVRKKDDSTYSSQERTVTLGPDITKEQAVAWLDCVDKSAIQSQFSQQQIAQLEKLESEVLQASREIANNPPLAKEKMSNETAAILYDQQKKLDGIESTIAKHEKGSTPESLAEVDYAIKKLETDLAEFKKIGLKHPKHTPRVEAALKKAYAARAAIRDKIRAQQNGPQKLENYDSFMAISKMFFKFQPTEMRVNPNRRQHALKAMDPFGIISFIQFSKNVYQAFRGYSGDGPKPPNYELFSNLSNLNNLPDILAGGEKIKQKFGAQIPAIAQGYEEAYHAIKNDLYRFQLNTDDTPFDVRVTNIPENNVLMAKDYGNAAVYLKKLQGSPKLQERFADIQDRWDISHPMSIDEKLEILNFLLELDKDAAKAAAFDQRLAAKKAEPHSATEFIKFVEDEIKNQNIDAAFEAEVAEAIAAAGNLSAPLADSVWTNYPKASIELADWYINSSKQIGLLNEFGMKVLVKHYQLTPDEIKALEAATKFYKQQAEIATQLRNLAEEAQAVPRTMSNEQFRRNIARQNALAKKLMGAEIDNPDLAPKLIQIMKKVSAPNENTKNAFSIKEDIDKKIADPNLPAEDKPAPSGDTDAKFLGSILGRLAAQHNTKLPVILKEIIKHTPGEFTGNDSSIIAAAQFAGSAVSNLNARTKLHEATQFLKPVPRAKQKERFEGIKNCFYDSSRVMEAAKEDGSVDSLVNELEIPYAYDDPVNRALWYAVALSVPKEKMVKIRAEVAALRSKPDSELTVDEKNKLNKLSLLLTIRRQLKLGKL